MKRIITLTAIMIAFTGAPLKNGRAASSQQNSAKTEIPNAGPCTNFPERYRKLPERLAWFYGCMHENPPTIAEIKAKLAMLPLQKRALLETSSLANQEALLGVASGDLPIQVFPK